MPKVRCEPCRPVAACVSIKILTRYFQTKTLTPSAIYYAAVGLLSLIVLGYLSPPTGLLMRCDDRPSTCR